MTFYRPILNTSHVAFGKTVFVMRHCQSVYNFRRRNGLSRLQADELDPPLSVDGLEDARAKREVFSELDIDLVFCSPLRRAKQTASILTDEEKLAPVIVVPSLREKRGDLLCDELLTSEDCRASRVGDEGAKGRYLPEDERAFQDRVFQARALVASHPAQRILVISHGALLAEFAQVRLGNGVIARVVI